MDTEESIRILSGWGRYISRPEQHEAIDAIVSSYAALKTENERLRGDAERYRWLRNAGEVMDDVPIMQDRGFAVGVNFDEAIDEARQQGGGDE